VNPCHVPRQQFARLPWHKGQTIQAFAIASDQAFVAGMPAEANALLTTSLKDWCRCAARGMFTYEAM